jgi:hypothetical protein
MRGPRSKRQGAILDEAHCDANAWWANVFRCGFLGPTFGGAETIWRTKSECDTFISAMSARSCRVTITDLEGIAHSVEVTASSLYEAVALGLAAIRGNRWVSGIPNGFNPVKVRVMDIPVDHEVQLKDFTSWLERRGNSPKEVTDRKKIRDILGLARSI